MSYPFDCISEFIFVQTEIKPADIILIPGGSYPQLMEKASELYLQGLSQFILPSGRHNPKIKDYASEWEFLKTIGINLGVPEEKILKEDEAKDTFQNAEYSWNVILKNSIDVKKVILVCKAYHSRRALLTYQSVFPKYVEFYVAPVIDKRNITKENWYLSKERTKIVMGEVAKIGKYMVDVIPELVTAKNRYNNFLSERNKD